MRPSGAAEIAAKALEILECLASLYPDDEDLQLKAMQLQDHLQLVPMGEVLARVPGKTINEKTAAIGVTRQCWHLWQNGATRPNAAQARRLAQLTGINTFRIRPRDRLDKVPARARKSPIKSPIKSPAKRR